MFRRVILSTLFACALSAQTAQPPQLPQVPAAGQAPPTAQTEQAAPVVFPYEGKPIALPFRCSLEDVRWAGMSCSEDEPCPLYLELASAEAVGDHIFAAGNIHSDAVTLYSILLMSGDAGHSWQAAPGSMRGAGLDHIQLLDALTGWISGQTLFPIP